MRKKRLKNGAIVFDASYPRSIYITKEDVLLADGVVMEPPGRPRFNFNFGLPKGLCFPCMAEPITLYFEKRYEPYSLGKNISSDKADEIYKLALKHGFRTGALTCYEKVIPTEQIRLIRRNIRRRSSIFSIIKK